MDAGGGTSLGVSYSCPAVAAATTATDTPTQRPDIALPDLVGVNGQVAENRLDSLGLQNSMESATPKYHIMLSPKN